MSFGETIAICTAIMLSLVSTASAQETFTPSQLDFFENEVRPILVQRCYECHADGEAGGGLSLQSRKAMLSGGETGAAIVPGDADASLIIEAIRYDGNYEMPPDSKLPDEEIAVLEKWVAAGAAWPQHSDIEVEAAGDSFDIEARKETHWCWQPLQHPELPSQLDGTPIDFLINRQLDAQGLQPNEKADRSTLLRRVSFDLTGLPPNETLVKDFVVDESIQLEAVIDQLLASPHFGERWARHWMDLARYAETYGHEFDYPIRNAWRYRDYLIRAFNADVPYDQFVVEHLAGDLLPQPRRHPTQQFNESILATGFWFLGEATHAPVDAKEDEARRVDNQIDVMSRSFLGLTVACARCHDHKFDAISAKDYYALSGFLQSSRRQEVRVDVDGASRAAAERATELLREMLNLKQEFSDRVRDTDVETLAVRLAAAVQGELAEETEPLRRAVRSKSLDATDHPLHVLKLLATDAAAAKSSLAEVAKIPVSDSTSTARYDLDFRFSGNALATQSLEPLIAGSRLQFMHPAAVSSASLGLPFVGSMRSETFTIEHDYLHVRLMAKNARVRLIIDGNVMHEFNQLLFEGLHHDKVNFETPRWLTLGKALKNYRGHRAWLEIDDLGDGYFAVDRVKFSDRKNPPPAVQSELLHAIAKEVDGEDSSVASIAKAAAVQLVDVKDLSSVLNWVRQYELESLFGADEISARVRACHQQLLENAKQVPSPALAIAISDGSAEDEFVFIRGNHKTKGDVAARQFLTAVAGPEDWKTYADIDGSGRLQLAEKIVDRDNPLTSRVIVNRVWHHLFGVGIVKSVDNFGVLGQRPSNPELLDYLAEEFMADGWSLKRLVRRLMLTEAYQRSSTPNFANQQLDPDNVFLSRANVRRLQGESIRDSMLSVAGVLDDELFGPPVKIHLTDFMKGRGRPRESGPLDGDRRRSIYVEVRRNFLSPMMLAFDTPIPFNAIGKRSASNVPAQALILMNDPFVLQQAERFAKLVIDNGGNVESKIEAAWLLALSRKPRDAELKRCVAFVEKHAKRLGVEVDSQEVWRDFCHVVFNTKEFIFLN